jgi:hypothetical protein
MSDAVNWDQIAARFSNVLREVYDEACPNAYAEALRRTFGYRAAGEPGTTGRALPYEHLENGFGLTTDAAAKNLIEGHTVIDRMNREKAEQQVREMRAEMARVYREAGKDLANLLRERCNERTVPSRYRRDGVAWAADMIDSSVPKGQFGRLVDGAA